MILSKLSIHDLVLQAQRRDFTKWWSLCLMRGLGLPTLDAALIEPGSSESFVRAKLDEFLFSINAQSVLVRSDFRGESKQYRRGGITYNGNDAYSAVMDFIQNDRAVILLEPTNRFSNILSINITVDSLGRWLAESLSCGFDTSDLQRGLVTPQWIWEGDFAERAIPKAIAINSIDHNGRVSQRLESIAHLFRVSQDSGASHARDFLLGSGNNCLFVPPLSPPQIQVRSVRRDAQIVSENLSPAEFPYTLSYATLWDGRSVYWDITPGKQKWDIASSYESSSLEKSDIFRIR
ncbi:hypothetical protein [Brevundimonas sp.]